MINLSLIRKKRAIKFSSKLLPILLLLCWLPYIIIFYPGTMNSDTSLEMDFYFRVIPWTTHFPVFPTLFYGFFMNLGMSILNESFGLFLCNIIQVILAAFLLSYGINYIYELTNCKKVRNILFLFFAFFPTWPIHFYTGVKDTFFAMSVLWFILLMIKFVKSDGKLKKRQWFALFLSMVFTYLFRNNGVYLILLSFPFFAIVVKKAEKIKIIACSILAIVLCFAFTNIFTAIANISQRKYKRSFTSSFTTDLSLLS